MLVCLACGNVDLREPAREPLSLRLRPRLVWCADRVVLPACAGRGLEARRTGMAGRALDRPARRHVDRCLRAVPVLAVDLADNARNVAAAHRAGKARGPGFPTLCRRVRTVIREK